MTWDETIVGALGRLTEALSDEILTASDAEIGEVFPGRSGRVAADAWRQMVRRIEASAESDEALGPLPHLQSEIGRERDEDAP